jgi:hypothetical protein
MSTVFLDVRLRTLAGNDPESGGITFLSKISKLLPDYKAKYP